MRTQNGCALTALAEHAYLEGIAGGERYIERLLIHIVYVDTFCFRPSVHLSNHSYTEAYTSTYIIAHLYAQKLQIRSQSVVSKARGQ